MRGLLYNQFWTFRMPLICISVMSVVFIIVTIVDSQNSYSVDFGFNACIIMPYIIFFADKCRAFSIFRKPKMAQFCDINADFSQRTGRREVRFHDNDIRCDIAFRRVWLLYSNANDRRKSIHAYAGGADFLRNFAYSQLVRLSVLFSVRLGERLAN